MLKTSPKAPKTFPKRAKPRVSKPEPPKCGRDLASKKSFLANWASENKVPGKIQAWFSEESTPEFSDWRILNDTAGLHKLLKIEPPQKGMPTPLVVQRIHAQLRKDHLRAFKSALVQIWFRPLGEGRYALLVQANLHGYNSSRAYKSFLDYLLRCEAESVVACHQIDCRPQSPFDPSNLPKSVGVDLHEGFGKEFLTPAGFETPYHILDRSPRCKLAFFKLPEKLKSVIHPSKDDYLLEFNAGSGMLSAALSDSFKSVVAADLHAFAERSARERLRLFPMRNVRFFRAAPEAEWIEKFFARKENEGNWTVLLHPQKGEAVTASAIAALAKAKPGRILLISSDLDRALTEVRRIRSEGYMLRKLIPLDLEPGKPTLEVLFFFAPDNAGVLGNPELAKLKRGAVKPRETSRTGRGKKPEAAEFEAPKFVQRKKASSTKN